MSTSCDTIICRAVDLCRQLIEVAENGLSDCEQEGCILLYGLIMDSAFKIEKAAQSRLHELHAH